MIPEPEWVWQGHAGHFIAADNCKFRMATRVGDVLISTIGDYYYDEKTAKVLDQNPEQRIPIGHSRYFETYVFGVEGTLECGCAEISRWSEIDGIGANDAATATDNHMEMCRKWARQQAELPLVVED